MQNVRSIAMYQRDKLFIRRDLVRAQLNNAARQNNIRLASVVRVGGPVTAALAPSVRKVWRAVREYIP